MTTRCLVLAWLLLVFGPKAVFAQAPPIPPGDREPLLRLEAGGPTSFVTALTFSPDGRTLYAGGLDKVVRVWTLDRQGQFVPDRAAYRVPIGPGVEGAINAIALSPDGTWLAVAGNSVVSGSAGFRQGGLLLSRTTLSRAMREDKGIIYLFHTPTGRVRPLRGHLGPVFALHFAPAFPGKPAVLVSAGWDWGDKKSADAGVIRVWDVDKGVELYKLGKLPLGRTRPGLAVWHSGQQMNQMHIALAWDDGKLRVWELVRATEEPWAVADGMLNNTVAYVPGRSRLFTGSLDVRGRARAGQLQMWRVAPARQPQPDPDEALGLLPHEGAYCLPRALTLLSSRADGKLDHAALVLRVPEKGEQYLLRIVDLSAGKFGTRKAQVALWSGTPRQPVITAAPNGRFLAVAESSDHEILIFSIEQLLNNRGQPQRLRSVGAAYATVTFVRQETSKDKGLGLLLRATPKQRPGQAVTNPAANDLIFDVTRGRLTADTTGWKIAAPGLEGWQVQASRRQLQERIFQWVLTLRQGNQPGRQILLKENQELHDYVLVPARPPHNVPILAVASEDDHQPILWLYNAATGDFVRSCMGHEEPIRSLAASDDGRLLASVAPDQTVCVWNLASLDQVVGRLGALQGVTVQAAVLVARVEAGSPALGKLQLDERIEGTMQGGRLQRTDSTRVLYDALAQAKPQESVTLQVQDLQGRTRQVPLVAGRGWDDRRRAWLLGLGLADGLALVNLMQAGRALSPVPGFAVHDHLFVSQVDKDSPAWQKLPEGALVEGRVQGGNLQRLVNLVDFYDTVRLIKPSGTVTLQIRDRQGNRRQVPLPVGQGRDVRKPLLSLFITLGRQVQDRTWVGWNPHGVYDASDRRAERNIGWHFNTGNPEAPTSFALADQYRKEYYRPGILRHLVAQGHLAPALKTWEAEEKSKKLPTPKMTLWIDEIGPDPRKVDRQGQVLLQQRRATLRLAIHDFPLDRLASVHWQLDGGPRQPFSQVSGPYHTAVLAQLPAQRGVHTIRVTVRTDETKPQEFTQDMSLRYQPPPPVMLSQLAGLAPFLGPVVPGQLLVDEAEFSLEALILPGLDASVRIRHRYQNKDLLTETLALSKPTKIAKPLQLQKGDNLLEIIATNKDATHGYEEFETQRLTLQVRYLPAAVKLPPPRLSLDRVVLRSSASDEFVPIAPERPVVVERSRVRIEGSIRSTARLVKAEWSRSGAAARRLSLFDPGRPSLELAIREEVELKPGVQPVRFLAATGNQMESTAEALVLLDYRPRLPELVLVEPAQGLVIYGDKDAAEVTVKGRLDLLEESQLDQAAMLLDGRELAVRPSIDLQTQTVSARIPLSPGSHRLQVKLRNRWRETVAGEVQVRYARPPRIVKLEGPAETTKPLVDLLARVQSALPLVPEAVHAEVNGRTLAGVRIMPPAKEQAEPVWTVHLPDVPLAAGPNGHDPLQNEVRLVVSNEEAQCREPAVFRILYRPPARVVALPEIQIQEPAKDLNVTQPVQAVRFWVRSESPLKRVELVWEEGCPQRQAFDLANRPRNAQGYAEFQTEVQLVPRNNRFRVEAVNEGGQQQAEVVVNYLYMPVRLEILQLVPRSNPEECIRVEQLPGGQIRIPRAAPDGQLWLWGQIAWDKPDDEQLRKASWVRVHVNGALQRPAELQPAKDNSRKRAFKAEIFLNRTDDNQIEIDLPELKQDVCNRRAFAVACAEPEREQRLHLLVVGIGERDEKKLIDRALQTLQAQAKAPGQFRTPAFSEVRLYGPLTGYVSPEHVFTQLCLVKRTIDLLASSGSSNDVVMVYFQGAESVSSQGHFFLTSVSQFDRELERSAITCDGLADSFADTLGAKILLLDVERDLPQQAQAAEEIKDRVAKWPDDSYVGVLRYARLLRPGTGKEPRLLSDLKDAMQLRSTFRDVESYVAEKFPRSVVIYNRYYPASLAELTVSRNP